MARHIIAGDVITFQENTDRELFASTLVFAKQQIRALVERNPDFYPMYTREGRWKHEGESWTHWCDGFLPGMMWIVYGHEPAGTDEAAWWRETAIRYSKPLEPRKLDRTVHDLGFIFVSTYARWHGFTPDPSLKAVLIQAGKTMSLRFKEKGEYLRSFVADESLFIDIMMNVGIIFYAAVETGDARLLDVAMRHTLTSRRTLVRGDGSSAHEAIFDLETGECKKQTTHQGYRGDSCWSRGLAWALYGFGTAYGYSRDPGFLSTAEACADFYIANSPADGVAPWDFDAPEESRELLDTSAAAITASGLFQLSGLCMDPVKGAFYADCGRRIMRTLCVRHLGQSPGWEGILKGGVYHIHKNLGVNESVMWGEYFFLEALSWLLRQP